MPVLADMQLDDTRRSRWHKHLLWRIHRHYETLTEPVDVLGRPYTFTRIADPNRVLDEVAEEEDRRDKLRGERRPGDQLHLPYWAELWDSALGLAQFLTRQAVASCHPAVASCQLPVASKALAVGSSQLAVPDPQSAVHGPQFPSGGEDNRQSAIGNRQSPCSVLDLGCGMGFAGTVAASLGYRVLFADLEAPALLFARLNSLPWAARVRTRRLNWRTDRLGEWFGLIIGADILYERAQWEYEERFWRRHLAPGGRILLGEPGRQSGDAFIGWIRGNGWKLTQHEEPVSTRTRPIRVFELQLE